MPNPPQFEQSQGKYLTNFERKQLLKTLKTDLSPPCRTRIQIILLADEGHTQKQICLTLGCSQATARYWINMAKTSNALRWRDSQRGRPKTASEAYVNQLKELVSHSPKDYGYPFHQWTAQWLKKHLEKETGIQVSDRHINRLLKKMGLSTRSKPLSEQSTKSEIDKNNDLKFRISIRDLKDLESN